MSSLLHIRVPAPWKIEYHTLFDEAPEFSDGICTNLTEDLLQITRGAYIIDVGFYRDHYRILLIRDHDWERPLLQRECPHRQDAVHTVEEWARNENIMV